MGRAANGACIVSGFYAALWPTCWAKMPGWRKSTSWYRCHDRLLVHKQAVFDHLVGRWRDLFNISHERRGHYHVQHEPCWYAVRNGATGHWAGDRSQTTLWQIDKPLKSDTGQWANSESQPSGYPSGRREGLLKSPSQAAGTPV